MHDQILNTLATKSSNKQLVHRQVLQTFEVLKEVLCQVATELNDKICEVDRNVVVEYEERGPHEVAITFSGDTLVFFVHTNAFRLPVTHHLTNSAYVRLDENRKFYGLIHAYNFLRDSLQMQRLNDTGALLSRLLINGEGHYFAEGQQGLAMPITQQAIDAEVLKSWVERLMVQAMRMDLVVAPFDALRDISVMELQGLRAEAKQRTSKRLGFRPS